jgi:hypothetical protein
MAKSKYSFNKHMREKARKKKQEEKAARRFDKKSRESVAGEDPEGAGINPDLQDLSDGKQDI